MHPNVMVILVSEWEVPVNCLAISSFASQYMFTIKYLKCLLLCVEEWPNYTERSRTWRNVTEQGSKGQSETERTRAWRNVTDRGSKEHADRNSSCSSLFSFILLFWNSFSSLPSCSSLFNLGNVKALACAASTRYLGIIVDQYLTWKLHVDYVLRRVRSKLYALNRMKPLPGYLLCQIYQSFVLPVFDYCDAGWAVTSSSISKPLERLHSRFLRSISTCSSFTLMERRRFHRYLESYTNLFERLVY